MICLPNSFDIAHDKAAAFENSPKFEIWLRARNGMNNPLDFNDPI